MAAEDIEVPAAVVVAPEAPGVVARVDLRQPPEQQKRAWPPVVETNTSPPEGLRPNLSCTWWQDESILGTKAVGVPT